MNKVQRTSFWILVITLVLILLISTVYQKGGTETLTDIPEVIETIPITPCTNDCKG